jgi:hypothetical protein
MRLSFRYLVAAGTEGVPRASVVQFSDTESSWRVLSDEAVSVPLARRGRWAYCERAFTTAGEATTLALEFRIVDAGEVGEVWIDEVRLEPAGVPPERGP